MKRKNIKFINNVMHCAFVTSYKRKKFVYWKKVRGVTTVDKGYFYCPYIPLITMTKHKGKFTRL